MSLKANALTTLDKVKASLRITAANYYDSYIEDIINSVSKWVETRTGRVFLGAYTTAIVEYPDPKGQFLFLKAFPIRAITSIVEGDTTLAYTNDSTGDYRWERSAEEGMVIRGDLGMSGFDRDGLSNPWSTRFRDIVVTYKGGYKGVDETVDPAPEDLVMAVTNICANVFRLQERAGGVQSETVGSYSVAYSDIEKAAKDAGSTILGVIDSYAMPNIG